MHVSELNSLDVAPDDIFAELKRHLPQMAQPDAQQWKLVSAASPAGNAA